MTAPTCTTTIISSPSSSNYGASAMENILQDCQSRDGEQYGAEFLISQLNHISAPLARNMLHKIGLNETVTDPFHVLELGCGIGVVAPLLNETVPREVLEMSKVLCADASERLVGAVNGRIEKEGWVGAEARVVDAQNTGLETGSFTHVVSNIVYHTVTDSEAALKDSIRILAPGGTLAFTTWHALNGGAFPPIRAAFATFPSSLLPANYNRDFPFPSQSSPWGHWSDMDWIRDILQGPLCQLEDVHVDVLAHTWPMNSAGHFIKAMGAMVDVMGTLVLGRESIDKLGGTEGVRERVRAFLEEEHGGRGWTLTWVSIVAWGKKPAVNV